MLPEHPYWSNAVIVEDQELLDRLAGEYAAQTGAATAAEVDVARFLFGWVPVRLFDAILAGELPEEDTGGALWAFHLSGYYGGRWLRDEISAAQPDSMMARYSIEPTEQGFARTVASVERGLAAAAGSDEAVLSHSEYLLFEAPVLAGEDSLLSIIPSGLVSNFGYNQGYYLEILAHPPAGVAGPEQYAVTCNGPLSCEYQEPKLAALDWLHPVEVALADGADPAYAELGDRIMPLQEAAVPLGRAVWSIGLSVEGFTQEAYDRLLDISSSYLEDVQAAGLAASRVIAEHDVELGRRVAVAGAAMDVWLSGYFVGLLDSGDGPTLPELSEG
ncbi:MAG: hypothetical protein EDR02_09070 [Actinobacteria bacterium]|nr:MAG: hypothetical protein EDR02_09070 [Actinomycetota bacterium]RIK06538.1 MAG: hypothetical protein DCC48_06395 [Acidobacteriota bacterium]